MPDDPDYASPVMGLMGQRSPLQGGNVLPSQDPGPFAPSGVPGGTMGNLRAGLGEQVKRLGNVGSPMDWALEMGGGPSGSAMAHTMAPALKETIGQTAARVADLPVIQRVVGRMPELADRYPEAGLQEVKKNSPKAIAAGKPPTYLGKKQTDEETSLLANRRDINADLDAGNYKPYFDPEKRYDVDPEQFPKQGSTLQEARMSDKPQYAQARAQIQSEAENPEGLQRLRDAYEHGRDIGGGNDWYLVGQVHHRFVQEFGPEEGNQRFKDLFLHISGTTAGAQPEDNLMMGAYSRWAKDHGLQMPAEKGEAHLIPSPSGGQYVSGNIRAGYQGSEAGDINAATNPKRHNFLYNFLGHKDVPTLDEQMGQIWSGQKGYFGNKTSRYGPHEEVLGRLAQEYGVSPREFQEVAWAGHKNKLDGYKPEPFITTINKAIERTSRITGVHPDDVVRRGLLRSDMPLYGAAGLVGVGAAASQMDEAQAAGANVMDRPMQKQHAEMKLGNERLHPPMGYGRAMLDRRTSEYNR
jgi:hypothetical protein